MISIEERINSLRRLMDKNNIDAYLVPTNDFHGSEYVGEYFKCRKYITGFTGSAGTALITAKEAMLWTDGRYFIQAAKELEGTGIELMKSGVPGVPTVKEYLQKKLKDRQTLGFDGRCIDYGYALDLENSLSEKNINIVYDKDLIDEIWSDRPDMSTEAAMLLDVRYCGRTCVDKLSEIRKYMSEKDADIYVLTSLDDIAWMLNVRGNDILCNPVVLSYAVIDREKTLLYCHKDVFSDGILRKLSADGIVTKPYNDIYEDIKRIPQGKSVYIDGRKANYAIVKNIPENVRIIDDRNLTEIPKAVKNATEVENERMAHIKDGVAVTKFIYWLKKNIGKLEITETGAAGYLETLRQQGKNYMGPSFEPIVAYGANAAMCHYCATKESDAKLQPRGLVLFDTGGQYLEGTTDITRTVALGPCTDEEKRCYTAVLKGHLNLAAAKFVYGLRGENLDYLARSPLWELGLDYNHGTGHGVGYFLNVHEGPNSFRWKIFSEKNLSAVLEAGMITSNEPGYYEEGKFGIRTENMIVCVKDKKTEYGQFMAFENLTMVPIDTEPLDLTMMSDVDRIRLNGYHKEVFNKLSPYMNDEELVWLREVTREI